VQILSQDDPSCDVLEGAINDGAELTMRKLTVQILSQNDPSCEVLEGAINDGAEIDGAIIIPR